MSGLNYLANALLLDQVDRVHEKTIERVELRHHP